VGRAAGTEADKVLGMTVVRVVVVVVGIPFFPISLVVAGEPPADFPPPTVVGAGLMGSAVLVVRVADDNMSTRTQPNPSARGKSPSVPSSWCILT
jgi:hypothetical protein